MHFLEVGAVFWKVLCRYTMSCAHTTSQRTFTLTLTPTMTLWTLNTDPRP